MNNDQVDVVSALLGIVGATLGAAVFTPEKQKLIDGMLRTQWGGQEVYIKKTDIDPEARALAIRAAYNGRNRQEIMREHDISRTQFYRIIKGS